MHTTQPRIRWRLASARRLTTAYALLFPAFALAIVFAYYPAFSALVHAFSSWNNYTPAKFVGVGNFRSMAHDPVLRTAVGNIGKYSAFWLVMDVTVPLVIARLVLGVRSQRLQAVLRFVFMLQLVAPIVVIAELWSFFYDPSYGLINQVLGVVGLPGLKHGWLGDPHTALYALMFMWVPFVDTLAFLIYTAGLQGIDHAVMEAAVIDGSSRIRAFWSVEIPLLFGQIRLVIVFALTTVLTNFTTFLIMTNGGPGNSTTVPGLVMFQDAFTNGDYGYGSAIAVALFIVTLALTIVMMRVFRPRY